MINIKKFNLTLLESDVTGNDNEIPNTFLAIRVGKQTLTLARGKKECKEKHIILVTETLYKKFLMESKIIINKHGGWFRTSGSAENVPLDEYKDTALIKFVLKKLGK